MFSYIFPSFKQCWWPLEDEDWPVKISVKMLYPCPAKNRCDPERTPCLFKERPVYFQIMRTI